MSVAIRGLLPEDAAAIAAIVDETPLWQRHRLDGHRAAELMLAAIPRGDRVVVAEADGRPVGFAWWMPKGAFGRSPYLRLIGVAQTVRSGGVGAELMRVFEEEARAIANDCFLLVSDFNTDAQRFYERHGYTRVGALPAFVLPDVAEFLYRKVLKPLA